MPQMIDHIDAIARKKQRDVLFVTFDVRFIPAADEWEDNEDFDYETDPRREALCQWLEAQNIEWQPCGDFARTNGWRSYRGQIYLDIPFDEHDVKYQRVREHLENPDGSMRDEYTVFNYMTLATAMKNAHHDAPGFWEEWAENF